MKPDSAGHGNYGIQLLQQIFHALPEPLKISICVYRSFNTLIIKQIEFYGTKTLVQYISKILPTCSARYNTS